MEKKSVYKIDSKGKVRVWSIWVEGSTIFMESGLLEGKKVLEKIEITAGKNIGKANFTTPETQAISEAESKLEQKLRSGYVADLNKASQSTLGSGIKSPMLAQKLNYTGEQKGAKTLKQFGIEGKEVYVQAKLDGVRCLAVVSPSGVELYTRKGDKMQSIPHIEEQLRKISVESPIVLDGELYADPSKISFNVLNGLIRKETKSQEDLELLKEVTYNVYDIFSENGYKDRESTLVSLLLDCNESVKQIPSVQIQATLENIKEKLDTFLSLGYEGLMIRTLDKGYEHKRSSSLIKVKIFEDKEFKILDLEEDSLGRLGAFIMEMDEETVDGDGKPVVDFRAGISGLTHEEGLEMLKNKDKYIGKMATIEFFGRDLRPRFAKFKGVREGV